MNKEWIDILKVIREHGGAMIVYDPSLADTLNEIKKFDNTFIEIIDDVEIVRDTTGEDFNEEIFICYVILLPNGYEAIRRDNLSGKVNKDDILWLKKVLVGLRVGQEGYPKVIEGILKESKFEVSCHDFECERIYLKGYKKEDYLDDFYICSIGKEPVELEYEGEVIDLLEIQDLRFKS